MNPGRKTRKGVPQGANTEALIGGKPPAFWQGKLQQEPLAKGESVPEIQRMSESDVKKILESLGGDSRQIFLKQIAPSFSTLNPEDFYLILEKCLGLRDLTSTQVSSALSEIHPTKEVLLFLGAFRLKDALFLQKEEEANGAFTFISGLSVDHKFFFLKVALWASACADNTRKIFIHEKALQEAFSFDEPRQIEFFRFALSMKVCRVSFKIVEYIDKKTTGEEQSQLFLENLNDLLGLIVLRGCDLSIASLPLIHRLSDDGSKEVLWEKITVIFYSVLARRNFVEEIFNSIDVFPEKYRPGILDKLVHVGDASIEEKALERVIQYPPESRINLLFAALDTGFPSRLFSVIDSITKLPPEHQTVQLWKKASKQLGNVLQITDRRSVEDAVRGVKDIIPLFPQEYRAELFGIAMRQEYGVANSLSALAVLMRDLGNK